VGYFTNWLVNFWTLNCFDEKAPDQADDGRKNIALRLRPMTFLRRLRHESIRALLNLQGFQRSVPARVRALQQAAWRHCAALQWPAEMERER